MKLVLASKSRDRKRCFDLANIPITVIPSDFDERSISMNNPKDEVQAIAVGKAETVCSLWNQNHASTDGAAVVIAADTMVVFNDLMIGKAKDMNDAIGILTALAGNTHELITGVAILDTASAKKKVFVDSSMVHFQTLSRTEIDAYVSVTEEYKGRAGAYSLQERASLFIDHVEGSPTNVLGIPMAKVRMVLKGFGVDLLGKF